MVTISIEVTVRALIIQVPPHRLHFKRDKTIEVNIESKIHTRLLIPTLIRDRWHWFGN